MLIQYFRISVCRASRSLDQNGIETVISSIKSVNDVKLITYMQSVRANIMEMYAYIHTKGDIGKNNMEK